MDMLVPLKAREQEKKCISHTTVGIDLQGHLTVLTFGTTVAGLNVIQQ